MCPGVGLQVEQLRRLSESQPQSQGGGGGSWGWFNLSGPPGGSDKARAGPVHPHDHPFDHPLDQQAISSMADIGRALGGPPGSCVALTVRRPESASTEVEWVVVLERKGLGHLAGAYL